MLVRERGIAIRRASEDGPSWWYTLLGLVYAGSGISTAVQITSSPESEHSPQQEHSVTYLEQVGRSILDVDQLQRCQARQSPKEPDQLHFVEEPRLDA